MKSGRYNCDLMNKITFSVPWPQPVLQSLSQYVRKENHEDSVTALPHMNINSRII